MKLKKEITNSIIWDLEHTAYTQQEIAESHNVTRETVNRIMHRKHIKRPSRSELVYMALDSNCVESLALNVSYLHSTEDFGQGCITLYNYLELLENNCDAELYNTLVNNIYLRIGGENSGLQE